MSPDTAEIVRTELDARILVVDDEPDIAALVAESLRAAEAGWFVETETNPQAAAERLTEEAYDCLVTDLAMPGLDGLALAERVREIDGEIALIALSGRGTLESGIRALRLGFADFLEKPVDLEAVQRSVCRSIRRRRRETTMERRFAELARANAKLEATGAQLSQKLEIASHDLVLSGKRMARQIDDLAAEAGVARSLMGVIELEDLLGLAAELVADRIPCTTATLALYEPKDAAVGLLVRAYPESTDPPVLCWLRAPLEGGIVCRAAQTGKSLHVEDLSDSVLLDERERDLWREGRLLAVPVTHQDQPIGVAILHREADQDDFRAEDVQVVTRLARTIGPAILTSKVHHRQRCEVYAAFEAVAEAADRATDRHGHSARVLAYARQLAGAMQLSPDQLGALQIASRLHDIGWVSVPRDVADTPGPLSEEQWDEVHKHPVAGQALLAPLDFFGDVGAVLRAHHESYDGTGYPDRKAGEEIPLVARVIAVCDAFDAMTSPRPHRDALPVDEALSQLRRFAGQQFDPGVVEAFGRIPESALRSIAAACRS